MVVCEIPNTAPLGFVHGAFGVSQRELVHVAEGVKRLLSATAVLHPRPSTE